VAPPASIATRPTMRARDVLLIAAAAMGAAILTFGVMARPGGSAPALSAASSAAVTAHPSSAVLPATSAIQTWNAGNRAFWLGNQRGAAFELLAENKVQTWFGPTQPALVMRCTSGMTEVFVYTRSATRIEPRAEGKAVTVSVDGEPARTKRWSDSDDRVALFAPDGAAFAQRLLNARTLRFGYSPHNCAGVVAQFHVAGLAELVKPGRQGVAGRNRKPHHPFWRPQREPV
jgi:hypothetical protein